MRNPTTAGNYNLHQDKILLLGKSRGNMNAAENWKSVMTELHEKKSIGPQLQLNMPAKLGSSFDSGIHQQEYNSDSDEVSNSISATLNRLIQLSKEQQIYLNRSESLNSIINNESPHQARNINSGFKSIDSLSVKSSCSEANNLIEEVILKNSCANQTTPERRISIDGLARNGGYFDYSNFIQKMMSSNNLDEQKNVIHPSLIGKGTHSVANKMRNISMNGSKNSEIVVAIDIGTAFSGYAYAINDFTSNSVKVMKNIHARPELCEYKNIISDTELKKVPSILLLDSKTEFHSFGYDALKYFLNIEEQPAVLNPQLLLFDRFKSQLLNITNIDRECKIKAVNGISISALVVYSRVLDYFKCVALKELSVVLQSPVSVDQVRWIINVPATWSIKGKLFMQEAGLTAGLCSTNNIMDKLIILYECETTAAYCNISSWDSLTFKPSSVQDSSYFLVINCGAGSLDASIHQRINKDSCVTSEIHKASEIINNSLINEEFMRFLISIFGRKFLYLVQLEKPASLIDLMYQFETCKWAPYCTNESVDIVFRDAFLEFYERICGKQVNYLMDDVNKEGVTWLEVNILRLRINVLKMLFAPLSYKIIKFIERILRNREEREVTRIFFTGGLAKSQILQAEIRNHFKNIVPVVFTDHGAELCVLRGSIQKYEKQKLEYLQINQSYAIGIIKEFENSIHPSEKLVLKGGRKWCCDILDWLVRKNQILQQGEVILKRYTPTTMHQSGIVINIYAVERENAQFVTDSGVHNYGALRLSVSAPTNGVTQNEILLQLIFTGEEFLINALDTSTNRCHQIKLDNLPHL